MYEVVTKLFWPCVHTLSQKKYESDNKIRPTKKKFHKESYHFTLECYSSSVWFCEMSSVGSPTMPLYSLCTPQLGRQLQCSTMVPPFCDFRFLRRCILSTDKQSYMILLKYKKVSYYNRWLIGLFHIENNPSTCKKRCCGAKCIFLASQLSLWLNTSHINTVQGETPVHLHQH